MFCRAMEIGLLGSRIAYALKEPYILVYFSIVKMLPREVTIFPEKNKISNF